MDDANREFVFVNGEVVRVDTMKIEPLLKPGQKEGRVRKTRAEMQAYRRKLWDNGNRECSWCHREIMYYENFVLDHIEPASGFRLKNDADWNLAPIHGLPCNMLKGSRRTKK